MTPRSSRSWDEDPRTPHRVRGFSLRRITAGSGPRVG